MIPYKGLWSDIGTWKTLMDQIPKDKDQNLVSRMEMAVDGEYQAYKANDGAFVREPFLELFGEGPLGYSSAHSFLISLNTITATIINFYNTIKIACKVPQKKIEKNFKKLDKYLDKKPVKKQKMEITIKD